MKRFLVLFGIFICSATFAHTINWHVDGNIYQTTTCSAGDSVTPPTAPSKYGYHFVKWIEYIPIEYLESTGKQWIDTGVIPTENTKFRIKVNMHVRADVVGYQVGYTDGSWQSYRLFNHDQQIYFDIEGGSYRIYGSQFLNDHTYDFLLGTHYVKSAETQQTILGQSLNISFTGVAPLKILTPSTDTSQSKIFLFQAWDNDTLVRDMIPVLDSNNVPCMYDKVSRQFFYNQGTGQFIAGPVVSE